MRAISLWQPWATAIAVGAKRIETRGWSTPYRGPLAIHAAQRKNTSELIYLHSCWNWQGAMRGAGWTWGKDSHLEIDRLPFGAIVAVCDLVDCRPTGSFTLEEIETRRRPAGETLDSYSWTERQMGNYELGRYGWALENVRALNAPVPWKGKQGFFHVPDELVLERVAA